MGYILFEKESVSYVCFVPVHVKEGPFANDSSLVNSENSYFAFWLVLLYLLSYFLWSPCFAFSTDFDALSSSMEKFLSINSTAYVVFFAQFQRWLSESHLF